MMIDWFFTITALILFAYSVYLVHQKIDISPSHAVLFGLAAGLFVLPNVVNFEWSKSGLKFTTKAQSSVLADEIKAMADQQKQLSENVNSLIIGAQAANDRIEILQKAINLISPTSDVPVKPVIKGEFYNLLLDQNKKVDNGAAQTIFRIDQWKQDLVAPAPFLQQQ